jgi:hypothetical protein
MRPHLFKGAQIPIFLSDLSHINKSAVSVRIVDRLVVNTTDNPLGLD